MLASALALPCCLFCLFFACSRADSPGDGAEMPEPFSIEYHYSEGSLPPPHHYSYDILIRSDGVGEIRMRPDYPGDDTPEWRASFEVSASVRAGLWEIADSIGVFAADWEEDEDPPVGGESRWARIGAGGEFVSVPAFPKRRGELDRLYEAVESCVPVVVWEDFRARRQEYVEARE